MNALRDTSPRLPDRSCITRFVSTMYGNADPDSYVSFRAFADNGRRDAPLFTENVRVRSPNLIESAYQFAFKAANAPEPAVFAPPVATFTHEWRARLDDLANGLSLSVECDEHPKQALETLTLYLPAPTFVVESGGLWLNPTTGEHESKLHLHWKLNRPTREPYEHLDLRSLRKLACYLVGADATNISVVHPIRGPGSWHLKRSPKLVRIVNQSDTTIDLHEALDILRSVPSDRFAKSPTHTLAKPNPEKTADIRDIAAALAVIPNTTLNWDEWMRFRLAIWSATGGDPHDGFDLFDAFSAKHPKYNSATTEAEWFHTDSSPPNNIGAGTIFYEAKQADPTFVRPSVAAERAEIAQRFFREIRDEAPLFPPDASEARVWPPPLDLFVAGKTTSRLELPKGCLPSVIDAWVDDVSERMGAPPAFAAAAAVAVVSAAIGSRLTIQPKQFDTSWTTPAFLWVALVEDPGGKKSPIIGAALKPLMRLNAEHSAIDQAALRIWQKRSRSRKGDAPDPGPEPRVRRYVIDVFTMEVLRKILGDNPGGAIISTDELTQLFGAMDAYKSNKGADRPLLLRLFDGGGVSVDRVSSGYAHVSSFGAGVIGGIQPRVMSKLAKELDADGLLQRFVVVNGDGVRREPADRVPNWSALNAYEALVAGIISAEFRFPDPIKLSPEARVAWNAACARIEALFDLQQISDAWKGHLGKWQTILARLFLTFHVCDGWHEHGLNISEVPLDGDTAKKAVRMADFLLSQSAQFYEQYIGMGDSADDALWFATYLLTHPQITTLSERDIYQTRHDLRGAEKRASRLEIMRHLELAGWCEPLEVSTKGSGHKWEVNPCIHDRFAEEASRRSAELTDKRARMQEAFNVRRGLANG